MQHEKKKKQTKKQLESLKTVHVEAIRRFESSYSAESGQRDEALEDMRFVFVEGSQWDDVDVNSRKDRPRFEINKVAVPVNQAIGEQRQNRISMKARAAKGQATKKIADVYSGLIRNIEQSSRFKDVKDNAFKEIVSGGFGAWYLTVGYASDNSFEQEIQIKTIRSAASSVYYDPSATDELKQDAMWVIVTEDVDKEYFRKMYPGATVGALPSHPNAGYQSQWQTRDTVRIADYWVKEPTTVEITLMSNGEVLEMTDVNVEKMQILASQGITPVKTRTRPCYNVVHYKISGSEVIDGPHPWAGKMIPVVPIFGYNVWINGQHYYRGMVRMAKDPQRVYNYATSQAIETSALTPKDPYWVTPKQIQGHERQLANFNVTNNPFMIYNVDPDTAGPPMRSGAPSVQTALIQQVQQADADVQATTGAYAPSLGENQTDQSGRAILALQRATNTGTHELVDNLTKAVEYTGQILIDLIPKIYDTERVITILGDAGESETITINAKDNGFNNQQEEAIDLSVGNYDMVSSVGPSYATKRSETLNLLTKLAEANPTFAAVSSDLIASSIDFDQSEELSKRVRKQMIDGGIVEPTEEEMQEMQSKQPQEPSPVDQINFKMLQLQLEQQAALVDNLEMQNRKVQADLEHKMSQTQQNLTNVIKIKSEINKNLDEQGIEGQMPIEPLEIAARQRNLQALNDNLEMTLEDAQKLEEMDGQNQPQQIQPPEGFEQPEQSEHNE